METLLAAGSANGAGTGASHTGPCTVHVAANSVFAGAEVHIQMADSDTDAEYVAIGRKGHFTQAGNCSVDAQGTYFLRAYVNRAGATTSLNVTTTQ